MCLNTTLTKPLVAKKDITVYKGLTKRTVTVGKIKTTKTTDKKGITTITTVEKEKSIFISRRNCPWVIGKTNSVKSMGFRKDYGIVERALHAYNSKKSAKGHGGVLAQCVIPKGAKYFTGNHNGKQAGTASDKLKLVKILTK